ncbi:MAG: preprotein translocase subunit YajC [Clostridia bacterium]|nr:preprotein translocase subunit YajC [Clostridia bacterium]
MFSLFITAYAEPAAAQAQAGAGGMLTSLLPLIIMIAVFYFLLIRPQKKKEKELKNMLAALKVNDEVATIGGIHGKIVRIKDDLFVLESGIGTNKSFITVDRSAVSRFIKRGEEENKPTPIPGEVSEAETTEE